MKKIAFSFALVCVTITSLLAQQQPSFTAYVNKYASTAPMENRLGQYNNNTSSNFESLNFFVWLLTGWNAESEYDYVTSQQLTDKRNYAVGFRAGAGKYNRMQIGMSLNRFEYDLKKKWSSGAITNDTERFTTIMTDVQYTWLRRKYVACYSGLGVGMTQHKYDNPIRHTSRQKNTGAANINLLGVRANYGVIGAQIEIGYGTVGSIQGGVNVKI